MPQVNPMPLGPYPLSGHLAAKFIRDNLKKTNDDIMDIDQVRWWANRATDKAHATGLEEEHFEGMTARINSNGPGLRYSFGSRTGSVACLLWTKGEWHLTDAYTNATAKGTRAGVEVEFTSDQKRAMPERDEYWK